MTDLQRTITEALRGRRSASRELWQRVAAGEVDAELLGWLRAVAAKVLEADQVAGNRRPDRITAAVGLTGTPDRNAELREVIELFDTFGSLVPVPRGHESRALAELLRQRGLVEEEATDDEIRKRVARLRKGQ